MEPENITPPPAVSVAPKAPPRRLYLFGGVTIVLLTLALVAALINRSNSNNPGETASPDSSSSVSTIGWPKYRNSTHFYELTLPPKWVEISHSPRLTNLAFFNADGGATLEITAQKDLRSLDDYLAAEDSGAPSAVKVTKSNQVKVGTYDGIERAESWSAQALQSLVTYVKIEDMLYTFTLIPPTGKSAVTNESVIRDYHAALTSFRLTDTSGLGVDLKDYASQKVSGLAFNAFSLKYPQNWVLRENVGDRDLEVSIYRNNYEITISQKAVGAAVCLFNDSPPFEGSSGDLRNKQFAEFNTEGGSILRRYFNANAGDKSTMFFCEKQPDGPYFQTPLTIGGLVYNVPAKYDPDIIQEMDAIVKTIMIVTESTTP